MVIDRTGRDSDDDDMPSYCSAQGEQCSNVYDALFNSQNDLVQVEKNPVTHRVDVNSKLVFMSTDGKHSVKYELRGILGGTKLINDIGHDIAFAKRG